MIDRLKYVPDFFWNLLLKPWLGKYDWTKDHDLTSLVFYWRELFHLIGGVLLGWGLKLVLQFFIPQIWANVLACCIVALALSYKELVKEAASQPQGIDFKNVVDSIVWSLGAVLANYELLTMLL